VLTRPLRYALAAAIVALLVLHAIMRSPSQLLWTCHLASMLVVIGLVADVPRLLAIGLVFQTGAGLPAYVFGTIVEGDTTLRSVFLHTVPLAASAAALWRRPLPSNILFPACLLHLVAIVLAYVFADPALNVMLIRAPIPPLVGVMTTWESLLATTALAFVMIALGWLALQLVWRRCN
jgi:hypothetical protein